ncbi:MAG: GNAT family N-acetyltransferase [Candidatus Brocadia sp.]|nr:MAG: GNAT family N-acetyltransferase [Candidatus Brocadia sp. AMX2]MBC6933027.1 GNAT family N-acetyltransferase [Candidatus Brocadia sp.]MBL1169088.1 GNAT family N-acetyltransferase [Candidatus Brocadia sp. AMX1]MCQ3918014.1 GNAT family N-acetyltransferase [Candidatus Brocadia sp.]MDL1936188.1 GNAT family N-acetyltransferase [Candidatus Brocadia sp. AMX2]
MHFKDIYPVEEVKKRLNNKECVYLVGKEDGQVVGFVFAWVSEGGENLHWMGLAPGYRKKGYGEKLLMETIKRFMEKGCHEAKLFTYPSAKEAYHFFKSTGLKLRGLLKLDLWPFFWSIMLLLLTVFSTKGKFFSS